ncbi:MAG TPA: hypothetical protein VF069_29465 [Streptosporangiaceae bacterium]
MTLSTEVTDSLDGVGADDLFALDGTVGALGSRGRLVQHSQDPRWTPRYVVVRDGGRLRAALPIFLGNGTQWSDQIHNPEDWGYHQPLVPDKSALVGGRLEIRGSLRCADEPDVIAAVTDALSAIPELRGRELFFGYLPPDQRRIAEAIFGPVTWLAEYDDFTYPEEVIRGSLMDLPQPVRYTIRHGERKAAELGIVAEVTPWRDYEGDACELIAAHNERKGQTDHPELVRYRMDRWDECDEVTVLVAHASRDGAAGGAVTLLLFRDEVEVYEVGLPEQDDRHTFYIHLTFNEPRRIARDQGCAVVRAGLGAPQPKRIRGARAVPRHCGRAPDTLL